MTEIRYLRFDRLDHPIALEDAARLAPMIAKVFAGWPHTETSTQGGDAFVTIRPHQARGWEISLANVPDQPKLWDDVNVICDLVAEMAWERIRSNPELLCLHAAAVDFGGRLVVMPNTRRAGKSTLSVALARLGHRLFTDDFLVIQFDPDSQTFRGDSNGILPRVRLPIPQELGLAFRDWIAADGGPSNGQYKYLAGCSVAKGGTMLPLGAIVVLDRREDACDPFFEPIRHEDALASLITQNFARTEHASKILHLTDKLTHHLPAFRLTYHSAEAAAEFLSAHSALQNLPVTIHAAQTHDTLWAAPDTLGEPRQTFDPARRYVHTAGVTETKVGDNRFLADHTGVAIHQLNSGSALIWHLLSDPTDLAELVGAVGSIFEDVDEDQILSDTEKLMHSFVRAGLVSLAPTKTADL